MRKRFCDVCEREIPEGKVLWIDTEAFQASVSTYDEDEEKDICQSCIIEAIGKLYMESGRPAPLRRDRS